MLEKIEMTQKKMHCYSVKTYKSAQKKKKASMSINIEVFLKDISLSQE